MSSNSNEPNPLEHDDPENKSKSNTKKWIWGMITSIVAIVIIVVVYIVTETNIVTDSNIVTGYDTSNIPFQYQLRLKNFFAIDSQYNYVISSLSDHEFTQESNLTARDVNHDNFTTNSNATKQIELGLVISRPLRILTPAFYEVLEDRYLQNGTMYRVITANASYTNPLYTGWDPPITIQFVTSNQTTYNDLISCKYQFTWMISYVGYINRKCKDESEFRAVSYVKGSSWFGFTFSSLDDKEVSQIFLCQHNAPFPTLIPALYTAYYNYVVAHNSTSTEESTDTNSTDTNSTDTGSTEAESTDTESTDTESTE
ncbi:30023_t:CDS:2 [Gigaspora margarita]|uniref:30023_t:CDS:1 n=1 Tax=Gigaspora margarita TaxID=4874 RepID=A0ABN7WHY8_GIGMA|nr:30023_t:CDS:2 [Gigaspora margarita]